MKWFVLGVALAGCAAAAPAAKVASPVADTSAANAERLQRDEAALLLALSTIDPRLALRFGTNPSEADLSKTAMSAVIAGDTSLVVHEGALDVFSFESRARGLEAAAKTADGWTYPLSGDASLERDLLKRLISEEKARLSTEKKLPASASELVRGLVATWSEAATPEALKGKDGWLMRRVDDVRESLKSDVLTTIELNELDDALDPLERLTVGYSDTAAALARLRIALSQLHPATSSLTTWSDVQNAVVAHLGVKLELAALRKDLERVRLELRAAPRTPEVPTGATERRVLVDGKCGGPAGVRSFGPSPERAPICGFLEAVLSGDVSSLADDVTVALWALAIHGERLDPKRATEKYRLESGIPLDREARLVRRAVVRPVSALGVGWAATLLVRENKPQIDLAKLWFAFGDAPLDVIAAQFTFARGPRAFPRP